MADDRPFDLLMQRLSSFRDLNPDAHGPHDQRIYELADRVGPEFFPQVADLAAEIIQAYLTSASKEAERRVVDEYFRCLETATRLLQEKGTLPTPEPNTGERTVSLLPRYSFGAVDWCRLLAATQFPANIVLAVDAARRRNQLLSSVMEPVFVVLHRVDPDRCFTWEFAFLESHRGQLDHDLVRDLLRAWRRRPGLPPAALDWVMQWSGDETLDRQWPAVVREADLLLRHAGLARWERTTAPRSGVLRHLHHILRRDVRDDQPLLEWLKISIVDMGARVQFFVSLSEVIIREPEAPDTAWRQAALLREVKSLELVFTPILILADLLLALPEGAYHFSLSFFGLDRGTRRVMRDRIEAQCEDAIRREFLRGLRDHIMPEVTIRRFCLGDDTLFHRLRKELDFVTGEFDSVHQRDKVVRHLAIHYASYREPDLLAGGIARRYRALMRVLHEDNLRRVLSAGQLEDLSRTDVLRDLAALAADVRRYLAHRRVLTTTVETMVAAELDFSRSVRRRRLYYLRKLLVTDGVTADPTP